MTPGGGDRRSKRSRSGRAVGPLILVADASLVVAHLAGRPPNGVDPVREILEASEHTVVMTAVVVSDSLDLLERTLDTDRRHIATSIRSLIAHDTVRCVDAETVMRAIEIYESDDIRFPTAHAIAVAETSEADGVASIDADVDRVGTVRRIPQL